MNGAHETSLAQWKWPWFTAFALAFLGPLESFEVDLTRFVVFFVEWLSFRINKDLFSVNWMQDDDIGK